MGRRTGRKRSRLVTEKPPEGAKEMDQDLPSSNSSTSSYSDAEPETKEQERPMAKKREKDKYTPYKAGNYIRLYDENSQKKEFIVFLNREEDNIKISDKDRLALSNGIRKHCVSGVMHLRSINAFKIGITFDVPNNANVFLKNDKLLNELHMVASIPASETEATGVLTSVPCDYSNKKKYQLIASSKKVISVRRFMRRVKDAQGSVSFVPTQTVAVTFASTQLPEYVTLDHWRHEVGVYVPPVKQCLRCMKFDHIAKYCKNNEVCSICSGNHNYKTCDKSTTKCANCGGRHIAISATCPLKKEKIELNKIKSMDARYADLFSGVAFPQLNSKYVSTQSTNLTKNDKFMNLLVEAMLQICSNNDLPKNSKSIREVLNNTFNKKTP
ncbi:uncharacterized protein LOC134661621 [Cydia amplana]|uniref:uncharacterized protein LOC134661621 n=1 Tax=Cydia amplana TaxID=1869771 RepID=UPI002FE69ACE